MKGTIIVNKSTAGSGKTRRILNDIDFISSALSKNSKRHALYLTFTRANIEEAKVKLRKVLDANLIRTIHSLCYEALKWRYSNYDIEVFKKIRIKLAEYNTEKFSKRFKYKITINKEGAKPQTKGDILLSLYYKIKNNDISLEEAFDYIKKDLAYRDIQWSEFEIFYKAWNHWKKSEGYIDFSDLLSEVKVEDFKNMFNIANSNYEDVFNLYIDEAQDLSEKMWKVIDKIIEGSDGRIKNIMIVGDDNQSIYRFQGAEPVFIHTFPYYLARKYGYELKEKESYESFRCPKNILEVSKQYSDKDLKAKKEGGEVLTGDIYDFVKIIKKHRDKSYMVLVRHYRSIPRYLELLRNSFNVPAITIWDYKLLLKYYQAIEKIKKLGKQATSSLYFVYEIENKKNKKKLKYDEFLEKIDEYYEKYKDIEYVKRIFAREEELFNKIFSKGYLYPVVVLTAHRSKGLEADIVLVDFSINTKIYYKSINTIDEDKESEKNLFFVATTRAKEILILTEETQKISKTILSS